MHRIFVASNFDRRFDSGLSNIYPHDDEICFSVFLRRVDGFFVIVLLMFFAECNPSQDDTAAVSPTPGPGVAGIQFSQV